jgi:hypothetical protein
MTDLQPLPNAALMSSSISTSLTNIHSTNVYSFLKQNGLLEEAKGQVATFLTAAYQRKSNEDFHNSLNFFERNFGFVSKQKQANHRRLVAMRSGMVDFSTRASIDAMLFFVEKNSRRRDFQKIADFYCGWMASINQQKTFLMQNRAQRFYESLGYSFEVNGYHSILDTYLGRDGYRPATPGLEREDLEDLYINLLTACDLSSEAARQRAAELGTSIGLSSGHVETLLNSSHDGSELASRLMGFSALGYGELFSDLFANKTAAQQSAGYLVEHDPFFEQREERKQMVKKGTVVGTAALLTLVTGPAGDVCLTLAAPMVASMLEKESSMDELIKINRGIRKIKRLRGEQSGG